MLAFSCNGTHDSCYAASVLQSSNLQLLNRGNKEKKGKKGNIRKRQKGSESFKRFITEGEGETDLHEYSQRTEQCL